MTSSRQLAGMIGPTLIVLTISETINLHIWVQNLAPVTYLNGLLLFVAGLATVHTHNRWVRAWPVTVTLVGWILLLGGLFRMFAPEAQQGGKNLPTYVLLTINLAAGVFLTFKSYGPREGILSVN